MFYYRNHIPEKGTIVIAKLALDDESEHCFYAHLPEYNNITAIIQKSELPKRKRTRKRILAKLRRLGSVPCIVSTNPKINNNNQPDLIEISMRGVDKTFTDDIFSRYRNIEKILRIVKFISFDFNLDYDKIINTFHEKDIAPLCDINEEKGVDTCADMYNGYLMNKNKLIKMLNVEEITGQKIRDKLNVMINEVKSSSTLDFELAVWKSKNKDAIFVIRDLFKYLAASIPGVEIRYVGAPTYQISLPEIKSQMVDPMYLKIKELIKIWMTDNEVFGYGLNFDSVNKEIKQGEISISFPYKVDMKCQINDK